MMAPSMPVQFWANCVSMRLSSVGSAGEAGSAEGLGVTGDDGAAFVEISAGWSVDGDVEREWMSVAGEPDIATGSGCAVGKGTRAGVMGRSVWVPAPSAIRFSMAPIRRDSRRCRTSSAIIRMHSMKIMKDSISIRGVRPSPYSTTSGHVRQAEYHGARTLTAVRRDD